MSDNAPPEPPKQAKPTKRDRATFRARLQSELASAGISGRALEKKIGMATGTLSKIFSGRLALTLRVLREIASALGIGPDVLVAETAYTFLLAGAPESEESAELLEARQEVDKLRAERAANEAMMKNLRDENEQLRRDLAAARDLAADAKANAEAAHAEAKAALATRLSDGREREVLAQELSRVRIDLAAERGRVAETARSEDGWRKYAMERHQRAHYLEAELARARAAAATASSEEAAKLLLASLASLGIGLVLGDTSSSTPRGSRPR